jgi:hypothetical protein
MYPSAASEFDESLMFLLHPWAIFNRPLPRPPRINLNLSMRSSEQDILLHMYLRTTGIQKLRWLHCFNYTINLLINLPTTAPKA